jgi:hypothetical protein
MTTPDSGSFDALEAWVQENQKKFEALARLMPKMPSPMGDFETSLRNAEKALKELGHPNLTSELEKFFEDEREKAKLLTSHRLLFGRLSPKNQEVVILHTESVRVNVTVNAVTVDVGTTYEVERDNSDGASLGLADALRFIPKMDAAALLALLSLILEVYNFMQADSANAKQSGLLSDIHEAQLLIGKQLQKQFQTLEVFYVVKEREVQIHQVRKHRSPIVGILFPGEVVRLVSRDSEWIEIETITHGASPQRGWVRKKYLQMTAPLIR